MRLRHGLALLGFITPLFGQYGGPAILSRGEAPSAMAATAVDFRPYVGLYGVYSTGLSNVSVNNEGGLANASSEGVALSWGISGAHSWRRTRIGLEYHGDASHYVQQTAYDSIDQQLMLSVTHELARHVTFSMRNDAGIVTTNQGLRILQPSVPFDPATTYAPTTNFFDNRTSYMSTQADLTYQKSARLSFDFGGDGFITRRRSAALYGVLGGAARADMQYRLSRRTTVGLQYIYQHYDFTKIFGGTDAHGAAVTFGFQLSRLMELTGYAGAYRVESKFIAAVPVDPVIAQLLGISTAEQVTHPVNYTPNFGARLSRTFNKGVAYVIAGHGITPGNGLFLTSYTTTATAAYTYTGLRHWSATASVGYSTARSQGNIVGRYSDVTGTLAISRNLGRMVNLVMNYSASRYNSPDYNRYHRLVHSAAIGIAVSPGEIPLRVW